MHGAKQLRSLIVQCFAHVAVYINKTNVAIPNTFTNMMCLHSCSVIAGSIKSTNFNHRSHLATIIILCMVTDLIYVGHSNLRTLCCVVFLYNVIVCVSLIIVTVYICKTCGLIMSILQKLCH